MDKTEGISIVQGDEVRARDEGRGIGIGEGEGKFDLLEDGVLAGNQRVAISVERRQEVHPEVVMFEDKVVGNEGQEERVTVEVKEGELMLFNKWVCEWRKRSEGGRQRGGVSYTP